jgi:hypothetical protein
MAACGLWSTMIFMTLRLLFVSYSYFPSSIFAYTNNSIAVIQKEADFAMEGSPNNEAFTRCRLNNILVCCIAEEKRLAMSKNTPPAAGPADAPPTATSANPALRPTTPLSWPAQIALRFETELKYPVKYKDQMRMLSGIADYSVWYDNTESVGTNLLIVEAKRRRMTGAAAGQVLAYMGKLYPMMLVSRY